MTKSYKELKKRQTILGIGGVLGFFVWIMLAHSSHGNAQVWLYVAAIAYALLVIYGVIKLRPPILCATCNAELTSLIPEAEKLQKDIIVCPFCGARIDETV